MLRGRFYRNNRARVQLELFLLSAIGSLLLVRLYLYATGFPQIGGGGLHIAHMLWGGILMLGALVISLSFLGGRAQRVVAVTGGVGFGVFIDELGKFITHNNDYFYRPAIALIYVVFVILYLVIIFLGRPRPLTSREYQLNALSQLEEAILQDMDAEEKKQVSDLLDKADQNDPLTATIRSLLHRVSVIEPPKASRLRIFLEKLRHHFNLARHIRSSKHARMAYVVEATFFAIGSIATLGSNIVSAIAMDNNDFAAVSLIISTLVSVAFVAWGLFRWHSSRLSAFEQFRRATLINLFVPQFFYFTLLQFAALPGLLFSLALLSFIARHMYQEPKAR